MLLPYLDIPLSTYAIACGGAFVLGVSKTGLPGLALINVVIMASLFGKQSVGIVLPLLIACDLAVYPMYRKMATWRQVWPLMIPAIVGVCAGFLILNRINDHTTKTVIGWIILGMLGLQQLRAYSENFLRDLPDSQGFLIGSGLVIGVCTTVANAAGPAYSIWALVRKLPKEEFLGIGARFFLLLNFMKLPFGFGANVMSGWTLLLDAALLPAVFAGIAAGRPFVMRIPRVVFERLLIFFSLIGALYLLITGWLAGGT